MFSTFSMLDWDDISVELVQVEVFKVKTDTENYITFFLLEEEFRMAAHRFQVIDSNCWGTILLVFSCVIDMTN